MHKTVFAIATSATLLLGGSAWAAEYKIDPSHSFVDWRIKHLGYSWMSGRFNKMEGSFSYDADKPEASVIQVSVDASSIDSNHAERDKHLRNDDFLKIGDGNTLATFQSSGYIGGADSGTISGDLTINGVTKPVSFEITKVGEGKDPWGGYRAGFYGTLKLTRADFGIDYNLGPTAEDMELQLGIEGVREK